MTKASQENGGVVARAAAEVVARLGERVRDVAGLVQQMLLEEIADLDGDAQMRELLRDTVESNIETVFSSIRHRIPIAHVEPPTAALEHARRLAQRGVSVNALVRAYRLGHKAVLNAVLDEVRRGNLESELSLDVFGQIAEITFAYIDSISQQVVATYQDERDRWLENRNSMRALRVRDILNGTDIDADAMAIAIHYPLRRIHLAAVIWCDEPADGEVLVTMERFVDQLTQSLAVRERSLFIPVDRVTGWAWIAVEADIAPEVVARIRKFAEAQDDAPSLAVGTPLPDIEGFRRSHLQAQAARAVALTSGSNAPRVIAAGDPGLSMAALVGANIEAANAWVAEVLGPLANCTESDERLRETLRIFLHAGSSFKAAAEELHLHYNSVKYRVQRAVQRRGRPIRDDRLDVEVALLLCNWYGAAVLSTC